MLVVIPIYAQDSTSSYSEKPNNLILIPQHKETDVIDIVKHVSRKITKSEHKSDSTQKEKKVYFSILPAAGYTLQTGFAASISNSIAFYTGTKDEKLSSIQTSANYTQYNQFIIPLHANIWTKRNAYNIMSTFRYMHYPSTTFGLNGSEKFDNDYQIDFYYLEVRPVVLKSIARNFYAGLGYYLDYLWNIREIDVAPTTTTIFKEYGLTPTELASGPAVKVLYDSRLNQLNPHQGIYSNVVFRPNFTFMGSQSNWQSLLVEFRKYLKLSPLSKNVLAIWSYNWLTTGGKPPYLLLPSTGWDDAFNTGRGYLQGRFRGRNMLYLETEYRFGITKNGLLGGVVFANTQAFSKASESKISILAPGLGTGLRIKLNKHSGTNVCIDYGIGIEGSRGFFVNLNEVF